MPFLLGSRAASAGYRLAAFETTGSTNLEAMVRARDGEHGPRWFVTSEQNAGRGRRNRPWHATRGNLGSSRLEVSDISPGGGGTAGGPEGRVVATARTQGRQ